MSNVDHRAIRAAIYGCSGERLTADEKTFFREHAPYGFILFARNCKNRDQVKALVAELHEVSGRDWLPILIDQEGGRVARLGPPHWRKAPPPGIFAQFYRDKPEAAIEATYLNTRLIASELFDMGITVDCVPMLDVQAPGSHDIIGDRALGTCPESVIALGKSMLKGLQDGGVLPVIKHIPGHGRATADSHEELPVVDASLNELREVDFVPFKALNDAPFGMTAHLLYTAIDKKRLATVSPEAIRIIREEIGFEGLLMTDDLSMHALTGDFQERTRLSMEAGCDLILHCNGKMDEMKAIAEAVPLLTQKTAKLAADIETNYRPAVKTDNRALEEQLALLLPGAVMAA